MVYRSMRDKAWLRVSKYVNEQFEVKIEGDNINKAVHGDEVAIEILNDGMRVEGATQDDTDGVDIVRTTV